MWYLARTEPISFTLIAQSNRLIGGVQVEHDGLPHFMTTYVQCIAYRYDYCRITTDLVFADTHVVFDTRTKTVMAQAEQPTDVKGKVSM